MGYRYKVKKKVKICNKPSLYTNTDTQESEQKYNQLKAEQNSYSHRDMFSLRGVIVITSPMNVAKKLFESDIFIRFNIYISRHVLFCLLGVKSKNVHRATCVCT